MGQYWHLFNLDGETYIEPYLYKIPEIVMNESFNDVVGLLALPQGFKRLDPNFPHKTPESAVSSDMPELLKPSVDISDSDRILGVLNLPPSTGLLSTIPAPIVFIIFCRLFSLDLPSFVCLSLANTSLFRAGYEVIQSHYKILTPYWAGGRLVAFGDYAVYSDTPEGMFNPKETAEFEDELENLTKGAAEKKQRGEEDEDGYPFRRPEEPDIHVFNWFCARFHHAPSVHQIEDNLYRPDYTYAHGKQLMADLEKRVPGFSEQSSIQRQHIDLLLANHTYYVSEAQEGLEPWVLCNLTTKEYVRSDAFAKDLDKGPWVNFGKRYKITFADCLTARVCWSSDPSLSMHEYDGWMHRGSWAGHRFVIAPLSQLPVVEKSLLAQARVPLGNESSKWKDVGKEVVEDAVEMLEGVYGKRMWDPEVDDGVD